MARRQERRLVPVDLPRIKEAGMYPDGNGLYLRVKPNGAKAWVLRYQLDGRRRDAGLGPFPDITLAKAREEADKRRRELREGVDPIEHRRAAARARRVETIRAMSFWECAEKYIDTFSPEWKNSKHRAQWPSTLQKYALPIIGDMNVAEISTDDVLRVLNPIWKTKPETASRVRGRIETVWDWAKARKLCAGENPALWRGNLDKLLPRRNKKRTVRHHPALPYVEIPEFMAALRANASISARALEFTILTAARTSEAIESTWSEVDLDAKLWIIPKERMKAGAEHRIPLTDAAVAMLRSLPSKEGNPYVFPGARQKRPLSNMAMLELLRDMRKGLTVHGFRSTFRDWCAEQTNFPREIAEKALAHTVGDETERAYQRGDLLEKRGKLMQAWARFCVSAARREGEGGVIVDLYTVKKERKLMP